MNTQINSKVEAVRRFFADSRASNHPIKEHPVSKADEYVRNLYFDMLCVVAQYECNDTENSFTLIKRIMSACGNVQHLEEYIRRSMELTTEKTAEFIKQCKDNNLCEIFFVDSLLLSCSNGTPNAKQVAFLSQFGDMLGFNKVNMSEMAKFAVAILEQDSEKYQEILEDKNEQIQENILCYAKEFVTGLIIHTSKKAYYFSKELMEYKLTTEADGEVKDVVGLFLNGLKYVKFENLIFNFSEGISLKTIENVSFENCHLMACTLSLESIDKIAINNCVFKWDKGNNYVYENDCSNCYYSNKAIKTWLELSEISITNTSFSGFGGYSHTNRYDCAKGTVFYDGYNRNAKGENKILFDNCDFSDIHVKCSCSGYYGANAILYTERYPEVVVTNCHFSNCGSDYNDGRLFSRCLAERNNKLVNSDKISW